MDKKKPTRKRPPHPAKAEVPGTAGPGDQAKAPTAKPEQLTPEEQMERFAQDLKENDWGHQPC